MEEKIIAGIKYRLDEKTMTAELIQKRGYKGDIIIPETVVFNKVAYRVTSIEEEAFLDCSSLTSITYNGTKEQWQQVYPRPRVERGYTCKGGALQ